MASEESKPHVPNGILPGDKDEQKKSTQNVQESASKTDRVVHSKEEDNPLQVDDACILKGPSKSDSDKKETHLLETFIPEPVITKVRLGQWRKMKPGPGQYELGGVLLYTTTLNSHDAIALNSHDATAVSSRGAEANTVSKPGKLAINSFPLCGILSMITGENFQGGANVLVRPFRHLLAFDQQIRKTQGEVESFLAQQVDVGRREGSSEDPKPSQDTRPVEPELWTAEDQAPLNAYTELDDVIGSGVDARRALTELTLLIEFMDVHMRDLFQVRDQIRDRSLRSVAFEHLWLLFSPGDAVLSISRRASLQATQHIYTVLHVTGGRPVFAPGSAFKTKDEEIEWNYDSETDRRNGDLVNAQRRITPFIIDCVFVDSDGYRFGPRPKRFVIVPYSGIRDISTFDIVPSWTQDDEEEKMASLLKRGRKVMSVQNGAHKQYAGLSLRETGGEHWKSRRIKYEVSSQQVHGEVILDQAAGIQQIPRMGPVRLGGGVVTSPTPANIKEVFDEVPYKVGNPRVTDVINDSTLDMERRSQFLNSSDLLKFWDIKDNIPDVVLRHLHPRVYGYALRMRMWLSFNIELVSDIEHPKVSINHPNQRYDDLVLPKGHKDLLQALVSFHTQDRGTWYQYENSSLFSMDAVPGKGEGLFILLHGPPGVGKTSTAELVAAQIGRPILPITCGDLGLNALSMEDSLTTFCRLAYKWRCVLLVDEADMFLTKREKGDFDRNANIAVFLRALDYFPGVMIFTSNRVGQIDEAFRSRIHLCLFYPKLEKRPVIKIWEKNLSRVKANHADIDVDEDGIRQFCELFWLQNERNPSRHWNGRQIKNAFQTAIALAHWEVKGTDKRPRLKAQHFKRIGEISVHFDDYIGTLYGLEDQDAYAVLAAREEIRTENDPQPTFLQSQARIGRFRKVARMSKADRLNSMDTVDSPEDDEENEQEGWSDGSTGANDNDEDGEVDLTEMINMMKKLAKSSKKKRGKSGSSQAM